MAGDVAGILPSRLVPGLGDFLWNPMVPQWFSEGDEGRVVMDSLETVERRAKTGIWGLDDILSGGLTRGHVFLLEGAPGTGKTTIALQFLMEGARAGEKCLYITLSETERELRDGAASHGWALGKEIEIFELLPPESLLDSEQQQSLLYSSDLELGETTKQIFETVDRVKPSRVVLDSLSEIRLLAQSSLRYRRQILAIKHYFAKFNTTVMLLDDLTAESSDKTVHSVAHGVLRLEELAPAYGAERRRIRVIKYRGVKYRGGFHDVTISTGGLNVFPRLVASEHRTSFAGGQAVERHSRTRPVVGRWHRQGFKHAGARARWYWKIPVGDRSCDRGDLAWREGGAVRVRRGTGPAFLAHERSWHRS
jgi:KaiC/GvpD/RAD55 family RecA-like ATPase